METSGSSALKELPSLIYDSMLPAELLLSLPLSLKSDSSSSALALDSEEEASESESDSLSSFFFGFSAGFFADGFALAADLVAATFFVSCFLLAPFLVAVFFAPESLTATGSSNYTADLFLADFLRVDVVVLAGFACSFVSSASGLFIVFFVAAKDLDALIVTFLTSGAPSLFLRTFSTTTGFLAASFLSA